MSREESNTNRPLRDPALLDALEKAPRQAYASVVWRSVVEGRDPLTCRRSGGRWDDGTFDVLYTSETRKAALEERRFHLFQGQPIPPSKVRYEMFELRVALEAVMNLGALVQLSSFGLDAARYGQLSYLELEQEYPRSQEIAEACWFLGADGIMVPSARDLSANNLIVFCEQETNIEKKIVKSHGRLVF